MYDKNNNNTISDEDFKTLTNCIFMFSIFIGIIATMPLWLGHALNFSINNNLNNAYALKLNIKDHNTYIKEINSTYDEWDNHIMYYNFYDKTAHEKYLITHIYYDNNTIHRSITKIKENN